MKSQVENTYMLGDIEQGLPCCLPKPLLSVTNLSVSYASSTILSNVSLDIYKGCITALIGPSGCGKTSFLSSLNRMTELQDQAKVTGSIVFDGQEILKDPVDKLKLRRRIGMIFQRPNPFPLSIWQNLALPLKELGIRDQVELNRKIERALTDVGLWQEVSNRLGDSALSLSGGQQQRLCIARALVLEPEVLLMDEPCSALDPIASQVVEELILRLRGQYTVVIVTHNLAQARRVANYVGFFWMIDREGQLVEFDQCGRLFKKPKHKLTAAYVSGAQG